MKKKELKARIKELYNAIDVLIYEPESEFAAHIKHVVNQRNEALKRAKEWRNLAGRKNKNNGPDISEIIDLQREANRKAVMGEVFDPESVKDVEFDFSKAHKLFEEHEAREKEQREMLEKVRNGEKTLSEYIEIFHPYIYNNERTTICSSTAFLSDLRKFNIELITNKTIL